MISLIFHKTTPTKKQKGGKIKEVGMIKMQ